MNRCVLIGRLTRDPELRSSTQGIPVCTFTLAVDRPVRNSDGNRQADFFNIVVWRQQADNCARFLQKGSQCAVNGTIQNRSYEKDGQTRYITEIIADRVEFLSRPNQQGAGTNSPAYDDFGRKETIEDLPSVEDDTELPF